MGNSQTSNSALSHHCWLSLIGIGEDGLGGLNDRAKDLIKKADIVFGGQRHLELMKTIITGEIRPWSTPFDPMMKDVLAEKSRNVCILASGDPFFYGVGVTLCRQIDVREMTVIPAPSSFSLAASCLGWALQDVDIISLHGRPIDFLRSLLFDGRRILALTSGRRAPSEIAGLLDDCGFGSSTLTVLEALGGSLKRIRISHANQFEFDDIQALNIVAIELHADSKARILSCASGLKDDLFEHDGQITKQNIRALTLSALAPRKDELLWDIGAGAGSISIEWMLRHPSLKAIAIERDPVRADRIKRNAHNFGVPNLEIILGSAPDILENLPQPNAIFIGGGGSHINVLETAINVLPTNGRLVANAVTLEMEALLLENHTKHGGQLMRIALSSPSIVGGMQVWRPIFPVLQWSWIKS